MAPHTMLHQQQHSLLLAHSGAQPRRAHLPPTARRSVERRSHAPFDSNAQGARSLHPAPALAGRGARGARSAFGVSSVCVARRGAGQERGHGALGIVHGLAEQRRRVERARVPVLPAEPDGPALPLPGREGERRAMEAREPAVAANQARAPSGSLCGRCRATSSRSRDGRPPSAQTRASRRPQQAWHGAGVRSLPCAGARRRWTRAPSRSCRPSCTPVCWRTTGTGPHKGAPRGLPDSCVAAMATL